MFVQGVDEDNQFAGDSYFGEFIFPQSLTRCYYIVSRALSFIHYENRAAKVLGLIDRVLSIGCEAREGSFEDIRVSPYYAFLSWTSQHPISVLDLESMGLHGIIQLLVQDDVLVETVNTI